MAYTEEELKKELETKEYEYGFYTDIESDTFAKGLNEEIVIAISKRKKNLIGCLNGGLMLLMHGKKWKNLIGPT